MGNKRKPSSIAPVVTKTKLHDKKNDAAYWRTQPPEARLAVVEQIRREYHSWKKDAQPGLQRVYTIVKRK